MECRWGACRERFADSSGFIAHVNRHAQEAGAKTCEWQSCTRALDKKLSRCTLLTHVRMHTKEKPFKCRQCNKEYSRSDALGKHAKTHEQMAADESIHAKKLAYLHVLGEEQKIKLGETRQKYKKLMVENEMLLQYICENMRKVWRA